MSWRQIFLFFVLVIIFKMELQAQIVHLSLDKIVNELCLESVVSKVERLSYENKLLEYENYKKEFLPSISFNLSPLNFNRSLVKLQQANDGQYNYVEDYSNNSSAGLSIQQKIGFTGGVFSLNTNLSYLNEFSQKRQSFSASLFSLGYSQKLFGGRRNHRLENEIEEKKCKEASLHYYTKIAEIQQYALECFMDVFLCFLEKGLSKSNLESSKTLIHIATVEYENRILTEVDYKQIKLQMINNEYAYKNASKKYGEAMQKLITYLGVSYEINSVQIDTPEFELPFEINLSEVMYYVEKNNLVALQLDINKLEMEKSLLLTKLNNGFNADINFNYGMNQYASHLKDIYHEPSSQQGFSIGLSIPIFQWGIGKNKLTIAKNEYRSSILRFEQEYNEFVDDIKNKVNAYNQNVGLWFVAKQSYELAQDQYQLMVHQFSMNKSSVNSLITAQQEQALAMQKYYHAIRDVWVSYYELRKLTLYDFLKNRELFKT